MLAILLGLAIGTAYADVVPPWESPDETWHAAYAEALAVGRLPHPSETYEAHHPPLYYLWPALALRTADLAPIPDGTHNPKYPFATSVFLHPPGDVLEGVVRFLRGFSGLLSAVVVAITWSLGYRLARRLDLRRPIRVADLSALLMATWPQMSFIGHMISNDVGAALAGGLFAWGVLAWPKRGSLTVVAVASAMAASVKLNALAILPAALVPVAVALRRRRAIGSSPGADPPRRGGATAWWLPAMAALGVAIAWGGLRIIAPPATTRLLGAVAERGARTVGPLAAPWPDVSNWLLTLESAWSRFGWMNLSAPTPVLWVGACIFGFGLLGWLIRPVTGGRGALLIALAIPTLSVIAFARNLQVDPQAQGRLLFPALPVVVAMWSVGWVRLTRRRYRTASIGLLAVLLVTHGHLLTTHIPAAYAEARHAPSRTTTTERILPAEWDLVRVLEAPGTSVTQGFRPTSNQLRRIDVPVHPLNNEARVVLTVRSASGAVVGRALHTVLPETEHPWIGVVLSARSLVRGAQATLGLELVDGGPVGLWGGRQDFYPGGMLRPDGETLDLVMLWHHQVP